jgi:hypothetical protein
MVIVATEMTEQFRRPDVVWIRPCVPGTTVEPGTTVDVEYLHWLTPVRITEVRPDGLIVGTVAGARRPMPRPTPQNGRVRLPYLADDAWFTRPRRGAVLVLGGRPYRVTHEPRKIPGTVEYEYRVQPADERAYQTRPGRTVLRDASPDDYERHVGRIVEHGGEYLHLERVRRVPVDAAGIRTWQVVGEGRYVSAERAVALRARWEAQDRVRQLEAERRRALTADYAGRPLADIDRDLAAAREAAAAAR